METIRLDWEEFAGPERVEELSTQVQQHPTARQDRLVDRDSTAGPEASQAVERGPVAENKIKHAGDIKARNDENTADRPKTERTPDSPLAPVPVAPGKYVSRATAWDSGVELRADTFIEHFHQWHDVDWLSKLLADECENTGDVTG